jgi:ABC-type branched-subunit amino acid transport system permease subunit
MIYAYAFGVIVAIVVGARLRDARVKRILLVGGTIALAAAPWIVRNDASLNALVDIGLYVVLALGLNITVGYAGLLDLGYAAFFAIGAYAYGMLASPQFDIHFSFWSLLFLAAALAALFGLLLGAPTLRLRGDYLAIVTLGFGQIVPQIFQNLTKFTGGPNGISALDIPTFFGRSFGTGAAPYYYVTLGALAVVIVLVNHLRDSRLGRSWMAIREDELAARHMGINTTGVKLAAFSLGAAVAGLAGVIFAAKLSLVSPDLFGFQVSVLILSMLVLGGMGNVGGVVVGAVVLSLINGTVLPQINGIVNGALHTTLDLTNYSFFIYGAILVLLMLFRPEGLLPNRERRAELHAAPATEGGG